MKNVTRPLGIALFACSLLLSTFSVAQDKTVKKTISKQIEVNDENGVTTVTVTTTRDGNKTVEVLTGDEAHAFMKKEHQNHKNMKRNHHIEDIDVSEVNGLKTVTVTKVIDGEKDVKVLIGDDAEAFLQHHENRKRHHINHENHSKKNIEVNDENGVKTVTITHEKDGKNFVKVLTGEEADAFLENHKKGNAMHRAMRANANEFEDINVTIDPADGNKTVTITRKNGDDEMIKVLTGEDADQFLAHHKAMRHLHKNMGEGENEDSDDNVFIMELEMDDKKCDGKRVWISHSECNQKNSFKKNVIIEDIGDYKSATGSNKSKTLLINDLNFYPNPNNGLFTINFTPENSKTTDIIVKDLTGKEIYSGQVSGTNPVSETIDITDQSSGVYILTLQQGNKSMSKKLLVE